MSAYNVAPEYYCLERTTCESCKGRGERVARLMDCHDSNNIWPGMSIRCSECAGRGYTKQEVPLAKALIALKQEMEDIDRRLKDILNSIKDGQGKFLNPNRGE